MTTKSSVSAKSITSAKLKKISRGKTPLKSSSSSTPVKKKTNSKKLISNPKKLSKSMSHKKTQSKISLVDKSSPHFKHLDGSLLDGALAKITPQLQTAIDAIVKRVESSPLALQDLQALGLRVLKHASEISEAVKKKVSKA